MIAFRGEGELYLELGQDLAYEKKQQNQRQIEVFSSTKAKTNRMAWVGVVKLFYSLVPIHLPRSHAQFSGTQLPPDLEVRVYGVRFATQISKKG